MLIAEAKRLEGKIVSCLYNEISRVAFFKYVSDEYPDNMAVLEIMRDGVEHLGKEFKTYSITQIKCASEVSSAGARLVLPHVRHYIDVEYPLDRAKR